jgi:hypothetical protein
VFALNPRITTVSIELVVDKLMVWYRKSLLDSPSRVANSNDLSFPRVNEMSLLILEKRFGDVSLNESFFHGETARLSSVSAAALLLLLEPCRSLLPHIPASLSVLSSAKRVDHKLDYYTLHGKATKAIQSRWLSNGTRHLQPTHPP